MLSALILTQRGYPAVPMGSTAGTPEVGSPRSSRTVGDSPQGSTPAADRDRTVSRRSEPNSRIALTGEQPDPWQLLHRQDATSRHRFPKFLILGKDYAFIPFFLKGEAAVLAFLIWKTPSHFARSLYRT